MTKTGNRHARRLLVEAAWHYRHPPDCRPAPAHRQPHVPPEARPAPGKRRSASTNATAHLTPRGKLPTVATAAVARELCGFIWATMTRQPLRDDQPALTRPARRRSPPERPLTTLGLGGRRPTPVRNLGLFYAIPDTTRKLAPLVRGSSRPRTPSCGPDPRISE